MKKTLLVLITVAILMLLPVNTYAQDEPVKDKTVNTVYTFSGINNTQQMWLHTVTDLDTVNDGFILDWFGNFGDLTPSTVYFWGRTDGSFKNILTSRNSEDFILGTEFAIGDQNSPLTYFVASERIQFRTLGYDYLDENGDEFNHPTDSDLADRTNKDREEEVLINHMYTGLGARWTQEQITASVAVWWNADNNYRITTTADITPLDSLVIRPSVWVMIDEDLNHGNPWAWWQLMLEYPINDSYNAVAYYEDSQLTDAVFMVGFSIEL